MASWLFPPQSERRLLPDSRGRPMPYVIAIMMFLTVLAAERADLVPKPLQKPVVVLARSRPGRAARRSFRSSWG